MARVRSSVLCLHYDQQDYEEQRDEVASEGS